MENNYPPLPEIDGADDLQLAVFTHPSLQRGPLTGEYGDTERLADLGQKVLEVAITNHLFRRKGPMLTAEEIERERSTYLESQSDLYSRWLDIYSLKSKFIPPTPKIWDDPIECRRFFTTYVGAVFFHSGLDVAQNWISQLIDPGSEPIPAPAAPQPPETRSPNNLPPYPEQSSAPHPPHSPPHSPPDHFGPPPQPTSPPPPMPPYAPTDHDPLSLISLALVHQTAVQKRVLVEYKAEQQGLAHMPTWTVFCYMNNELRGQGTGKSQKNAKEEAARQAYIAMGWMYR